VGVVAPAMALMTALVALMPLVALTCLMIFMTAVATVFHALVFHILLMSIVHAVVCMPAMLLRHCVFIDRG